MLDLTIAAWWAADRAERAALAAAACERRAGLRVLTVDEVARIYHEPTGLVFHLVPGGTLRMGIGDEELERLRAQYRYWDGADEADHALTSGTYGPVVEVSISPFLLAAHATGPVVERPYQELARMSAAEWGAHLARFSASTLSLDAALARERELAAHGLRLPSEAEWEWAARAGTARSFPGGDTIPTTPATGINPLGFVDLGAMPELCADAWAPTLAGTPPDGTPRAGEGRAVRGGAATCYPWQDCGEWTLLLCGARSSADGEMGDMLAVRPAIGLS